MNKKNISIVIFSSLLISSCGLIEKFKSPDPATQSSENKQLADTTGPSDDLFATPENPATPPTTEAKTDGPNNVTTETAKNDDNELKSIENEFSNSGPKESNIEEVAALKRKKKN